MAATTRTAAALALLTGALLATAAPGVITMPIGRSSSRTHITHKRAAQPVTLGNAISLYYVNATVGTPGQLISLDLDTGSSDTWMFSASAYDQCNAEGPSCGGGSFDPSQSSTYHLISEGAFKIGYATANSEVTGDYFSDDLQIGGIKLSSLEMALATQASNSPVGIMGISFSSAESIVENSGNPSLEYPNIIDQMVNQGVIASRTYSLNLNDLDAGTGNIIFGGYDTNAYTGELAVLDMQIDSTTGVVDRPAIAWTSLSIKNSSGTTSLGGSDFPMAAVLDSGTSLTVIPEDMYLALAKYFGALFTQDQNYVLECSTFDEPGTLEYGFGVDNGPIISVPFSELGIPVFNDDGNPLTSSNGGELCTFGLSPVTNGVPPLLGDTFLRSAYVVYDLDNKQIGIANANHSAAGSNIVAINTGIPSSGAAAVQQTTAEVTGTGLGGVQTTSVAAATPTTTTSQSSPSSIKATTSSSTTPITTSMSVVSTTTPTSVAATSSSPASPSTTSSSSISLSTTSSSSIATPSSTSNAVPSSSTALLSTALLLSTAASFSSSTSIATSMSSTSMSGSTSSFAAASTSSQGAATTLSTPIRDLPSLKATVGMLVALLSVPLVFIAIC